MAFAYRILEGGDAGSYTCIDIMTRYFNPLWLVDVLVTLFRFYFGHDVFLGVFFLIFGYVGSLLTFIPIIAQLLGYFLVCGIPSDYGWGHNYS